ncbi:lipoate--protein ligase family protein [Gracilinema caldarium]|uniref:Biotin/lipoate A/B protein ligase n=1 Tax=Gracilinema caldarium (strain ATCC 51460 / DSM 7334 / H1) TaxID=744872 RepID=F8EZG0_GRAC1|nr:lipoate--protein ligase family protein [Gracilinema caldarium]AEJ20183.1 biotin/lipoate A/B protein ligase [Gracilinema caldarium DSM 7334]
MESSIQRKRVIFSLSNNIYENLALENYLFEHLDPQEALLFLWRNTYTVVIGRFQDPEIECNLKALQVDGIPLARRQSGGGTVWHDLGNLCFTFMSSKKFFNRDNNLILIQRALQNLGFPVEINNRHDILLHGKKISGSAFREKADRSFHHGTILVTAELDKLHYYLKPELEKPQSRHTRSVSSPVSQLSAWQKDICISDVETMLKDSFSPKPAETISIEAVLHDPLYFNYLYQMQSRDWIYGPGAT